MLAGITHLPDYVKHDIATGEVNASDLKTALFPLMK